MHYEMFCYFTAFLFNIRGQSGQFKFFFFRFYVTPTNFNRPLFVGAVHYQA